MPAQAVTGSWWGLVSVYRQSRQEFEAFTSNPPMACPDDGEPLRKAPATPSGSGTELFCPYDGWSFPKDQHRPVRMLARLLSRGGGGRAKTRPGMPSRGGSFASAQSVQGWPVRRRFDVDAVALGERAPVLHAYLVLGHQDPPGRR
jgi:hypothetical protein